MNRYTEILGYLPEPGKTFTVSEIYESMPPEVIRNVDKWCWKAMIERSLRTARKEGIVEDLGRVPDVSGRPHIWRVAR